jgi:excisionase family DNA binding protein
MATSRAYGTGARMLTLAELCEWLNITERHARKLVERDAIPYRKVGRLLRFPEAEIEQWSHPDRTATPQVTRHQSDAAKPPPRRRTTRSVLPKTLIE